MFLHISEGVNRAESLDRIISIPIAYHDSNFIQVYLAICFV